MDCRKACDRTHLDFSDRASSTFPQGTEPNSRRNLSPSAPKVVGFSKSVPKC